MKVKKVLLTIIIMFAFLMLFFNTTCMAYVSTGLFKPGLDMSGNERAFELGATIVTVLRVVGTVLAVVGIMILGIKYMIGSVEQKAEYKKTMIPYIVGCIFIFAIGQIVSMIYNIVVQL